MKPSRLSLRRGFPVALLLALLLVVQTAAGGFIVRGASASPLFAGVEASHCDRDGADGRTPVDHGQNCHHCQACGFIAAALEPPSAPWVVLKRLPSRAAVAADPAPQRPARLVRAGQARAPPV